MSSRLLDRCVLDVSEAVEVSAVTLVTRLSSSAQVMVEMLKEFVAAGAGADQPRAVAFADDGLSKSHVAMITHWEVRT